MDVTGSGAPAVAPPPPGVIACYGHAWRQLWRYFWSLLLMGVLYLVGSSFAGWFYNVAGVFFSVFGAIPASFAEHADPPVAILLIALAFPFYAMNILFSLLGYAYWFLVFPPLYYGLLYTYLLAARDEFPHVRSLFIAFERTFPAILAWLLSGFIVGVPAIPAVVGIIAITGGVAVAIAVADSSGLLIGAPLILVGAVLLLAGMAIGVFLSLRLAFVAYLVVDEQLGPIGAVKESWNRTKGYLWTLLGASLLGIPIMMGGFFLFLVGLIPALMWIQMTWATLFAAITAERQAGPPVAPAEGT